jgi:hypothetical protein
LQRAARRVRNPEIIWDDPDAERTPLEGVGAVPLRAAE